MNLFTKNTTLAIIAAGLSTGLCGCAPKEKVDTPAKSTKTTTKAENKTAKVVKQVKKETVRPKNEPKVVVSAKPATFKWHTIYADAVKEAKKRNLPIFIDFTGSDWCGWCKKLDREVFEKPEWKKWAAAHLILMKADFPRTKKLPPAEVKVNRGLQKKYAVGGFPTIIISDPNGKKIGQLGYQSGGVNKYIATVKETLHPTPITTAPNAAGWYISLKEAKRLATAQSKEILLTMTAKGFGKFEEKFSHDLMTNTEFMDAIKGKYILLHIELVRGGKQGLALRKQNFGLSSQFRINKIPAVFILNAKGEKVKQFKSFATEATGFVKDIKSILAGGKAAKPVIKSTGVKMGKNAHGWYVNYEEALKVAKMKNIPLLVDFSGSDWCHWCMKLDKEVFNTPVFKKYAADGNIVMLMIDSPSKTKLPAPLKKQNELIKSIFEINSFPSVLLLNGEGELIGRTGYHAGGPAKYIETIKKILKK